MNSFFFFLRGGHGDFWGNTKWLLSLSSPGLLSLKPLFCGAYLEPHLNKSKLTIFRRKQRYFLAPILEFSWLNFVSVIKEDYIILWHASDKLWGMWTTVRSFFSLDMQRWNCMISFQDAIIPEGIPQTDILCFRNDKHSPPSWALRKRLCWRPPVREHCQGQLDLTAGSCFCGDFCIFHSCCIYLSWLVDFFGRGKYVVHFTSSGMMCMEGL